MRKGIDPGQTPHINDEPSSIFLHLRDGEVTTVENTVKIGGQRVPPLLKRHLLNGPKDTDPCVVDLDIDSTKYFNTMLNQVADLIGLSHITNLTTDLVPG